MSEQDPENPKERKGLVGRMISFGGDMAYRVVADTAQPGKRWTAEDEAAARTLDESAVPLPFLEEKP